MPLWTMGIVSMVPGPFRASTPCGAAYVGAIDLLQGAVALRVVGAAVHEPIVGTRIQEVLFVTGL